jgi:hypothetical protein
MSLIALNRFLTEKTAKTSPFIYNKIRKIRVFFDKLTIKRMLKSGQAPVIVYQQGRVASTSVYESLKRSLPNSNIFHVHTLSEDVAQRQILLAEKNNTYAYRYYFIGQYLAKIIKSDIFKIKKEPWKIITVFRDPIDIVLSTNFINMDKKKDLIIQQYGHFDESTALKYFEYLFENDEPSGWTASNWFDDVFYKELGVDVFSFDFDKKKGYSIIRTEDYEILLLRFESLKEGYKQGVIDLFNISRDTVELEHTNLHRDDNYKSIHDYIKRNLKLSDTFLDKAYSTKLIEHFYSDQLIQEQKNKRLKFKVV